MTEQRTREAVIDLYLLGNRQTVIAERLGITDGRVSQILSEARREWRESLALTFEEQTAVALARYEQILAATERGLERGDPRSVEAATKLVERIAKLLGLEHADRMNERTVRLEEAKVRMLGHAVAALLDHLDIHGEQRTEALQIMDRAVATRELV